MDITSKQERHHAFKNSPALLPILSNKVLSFLKRITSVFFKLCLYLRDKWGQLLKLRKRATTTSDGAGCNVILMGNCTWSIDGHWKCGFLATDSCPQNIHWQMHHFFLVDDHKTCFIWTANSLGFRVYFEPNQIWWLLEQRKDKPTLFWSLLTLNELLWCYNDLRGKMRLFTERCISVGIFSITLSPTLRITIWAATTFSGCKLTVRSCPYGLCCSQFGGFCLQRSRSVLEQFKKLVSQLINET